MRLNVRSIRRRLQRLEQYIAELEKQRQATLQTFKSDFTRQLAVERAFQAAIESCTDIAAHIVSVYQLGRPDESRDVYGFLLEAGYLDAEFAEAMMAMVAFRNGSSTFTGSWTWRGCTATCRKTSRCCAGSVT